MKTGIIFGHKDRPWSASIKLFPSLLVLLLGNGLYLKIKALAMSCLRCLCR